MPIVPVYNMQGEKVGDMELSDLIWNAEIHDSVVYDAVQS